MRKKHTKWVPLAGYVHSLDEFVVLARVNLKTGMMYFKVKKVNRFFGFSLASSNGTIGFHEILNIKEQWQKLMELSEGGE